MRRVIVDAVLLFVVSLAIASVAGCVRDEVRENLQPMIAVYGHYGLLSGTKAPQPLAGICGTCGTKVPPGGGTLGDGVVKTPCPECNTKPAAACPCGGKGYVTKDGKNWACNCTMKFGYGTWPCKDGKCPTPPTGR